MFIWKSAYSINMHIGDFLMKFKYQLKLSMCSWLQAFLVQPWKIFKKLKFQILCKTYFVLFLIRFVELAPQYYFSNLPPSESKDILQEVINHLSPVSTTKEEQKTNGKDKEYEKYSQTPAEQRCIIQWLWYPTTFKQTVCAMYAWKLIYVTVSQLEMYKYLIG